MRQAFVSLLILLLTSIGVYAHSITACNDGATLRPVPIGGGGYGGGSRNDRGGGRKTQYECKCVDYRGHQESLTRGCSAVLLQSDKAPRCIPHCISQPSKPQKPPSNPQPSGRPPPDKHGGDGEHNGGYDEHRDQGHNQQSNDKNRDHDKQGNHGKQDNDNDKQGGGSRAGHYKRGLEKTFLLPDGTPSHCASHHSPCPVQALTNNRNIIEYECITPMEDIGNCGGCAVTGHGQNCLEIPGIRSVSCYEGKCNIHSCQSSFILHTDVEQENFCAKPYRTVR